jgi:hypothetical protein
MPRRWWHHTGSVAGRRGEVRRSLRLSRELDDGLKEVAAAEARSVNAEIGVAIREHVERWRRRAARELPRVAEGPPPPYGSER